MNPPKSWPKPEGAMNTKDHLELSNRLIPGGANTVSKSPSRYIQAPSTPLFVKSAKGCYFRDIEGREYLDFGMGLGASILGYCHPDVDKAVRKALVEGSLFTLPSYREAQTADQLLQYIPWAEQVRFGKTGTDVTTAAVRVARAYTKRSQIMHEGYHGWADWSMTKPPAMGVQYNTDSMGRIEQFNSTYPPAAVVVEVAPGGILDEGYLRHLREKCTRTGTILIFDEVLSGFRYNMGSACPSVIPDLACFGKSIGNGHSISALVGKRDLMQLLDPGQVFFSGTFFGETTGLAACTATLDFMARNQVPEYIGAMGRELRDQGNDIGEVDWLVGDGARIVTLPGWAPSQIAKDYVQQECAKRGLLFMGAHNMSWAHQERDVEKAVEIYSEVQDLITDMGDMAYLEERMEGEPTVEPYRLQ